MGQSITAPRIASKLQQLSAFKVLRGLSLRKPGSAWVGDPLELGSLLSPAETSGASGQVTLVDAVRAAEAEMDQQGEVGLTVSLKEVVVHDNHDLLFPAGNGEIYVITSVVDGSGAQPEFKTSLFENIKDGARLPLGSGGMLVGMLRNPRWFVDVHTVIMESDSDIRSLGQAIEKARTDSGLSKLLAAVGSLAAFDPTMVTKVVGAVDLFVAMVASLMRENGDDHVATIHDFYLRSQAFGAGRHPASGVARFGDVSAAYEINLEKL